jgi:glycosyltransferase involved in cell wall biosynthesis
MAEVSVAVIALNEEERIRACLESVGWADEVVVVDSGSSDKTAEIAREFTERVLFRAWAGYGAQKNFALAQCRGEWVLALDADERVPDALREEILTVLASDPPVVGFFVPRQNFFQGRWIRYGGWYPDYQLRLFRRGHGAFTESAVHESVRVDGPTARLRNALVHQSYRGVEDFLARSSRYAELAAHELAAAGRGGSAVDLLVRPVWRFLRMYVVQLGLLDGWRGLVLAALYAQYVFVRAARVRELLASGTARPE